MSTKKKLNWNGILIATAIFATIAVGVLISFVIPAKPSEPEPTEPPAPTEPASYTIMDTYDAIVSDAVAQAYEAANSVRKVYWINENAEIPPMPNPARYGQTDDPSTLQWLIDDAQEILEGQEILFNTDIELAYLSNVTYYLDESILVITWQQVLDNYIYTFSEVKITHPSQFRRYLAGNEYNSDYIHPTSTMAKSVNAVMASSADYYRGRKHGIITYQGEVKRTDYSDLVDACFIDRDGNMILVPAGELIGMEETQKFVDENNIDFSLAFGPILIKDGVRCEPENYFLGEVNDRYPRAALCQKDDLHYIIVMCNGNYGYVHSQTIHDFAYQIEQLGCKNAYTLDGGATGTISMQGKALNPVQWERWITDIIYFATAIPYTEETPEPTTP